MLAVNELLEVKNTLICARTLMRSLEHIEKRYPALATIVLNPPAPFGIVDAISRCISDHGEILDNASEQLGAIRRELKQSHERLLSRLERIINDSHSAPMLQEGLITQRDGRYVLPLRSEFKGQIKSIVHDQSSSGATLFVEPLVVVELNNRFKELQLAERDEERRIMAALSSQIGETGCGYPHPAAHAGRPRPGVCQGQICRFAFRGRTDPFPDPEKSKGMSSRAAASGCMMPAIRSQPVDSRADRPGFG